MAALTLTLTGCANRMAGGQCLYENRIGTVLIRQGEDGAVARFSPAGKDFEQTTVRFSPEMEFPVQQPTDSERSDIRYPARLDMIIEGSCTPYRFELLSSEYFSRGFFLPFSQKGKMSAATQERLLPIAETYKRLSEQWPKAVVDLCGQAGQEGPADPTQERSSRYAGQVAARLKELGIPAGKLNRFGAGSSPCPRSHVYFDEVEPGVWISFLLTGVDQLSKADILLAEQDDVQAQQKILKLINAESSSDPDKKLAAPWVAAAAENGNPVAQYAIGLAYLQENGVTADPVTGVSWIKTAANNDHPPAQRKLGRMYFHGDIIAQDHARAYAWFLIAAENGDTEARQEVAEYEKYVDSALEYSQQTLDKGKKLVSKLKAKIHHPDRT